MRALKLSPDYIYRDGKPISVVLSLDAFKEIIDLIDDAEDVAWLKKQGGVQKHRPLSEYLTSRKKKS